MQRLSMPVESMKPHYPVVVVGSGYGGGIAASRLSRAGIDVCILERGREMLPGEYPDTQAEVTRDLQTHLPKADIGPRNGLYDFHLNPDISVLVGCGLGGTSLINAGITIRPDERLFDDPRWPSQLRSDRATLLEEGFTRAEEMLRPVTYPDNYPELAKAKAHKVSADHMQAKFEKTPMHITFSSGVNPVGIHQDACVNCGDCVTGCNYGSKSTTLMNYLPDAHNHGAEVYTGISVRYVERKDGKWIVHYQLVASGREKFDAPTMFLTADTVILAAGTLGSTELLLRSKAKGLASSDKVGHRFTGNGDALGYAWNCNIPVNGVGMGSNSPEGREPVGPFNTTVIDLRDTPNPEDGIVIEEGAIPGGIARVSAAIVGAAAPLMGRDTDNLDIGDAVREKAAELETLVHGPYKGAMRNTQTYLVMCHDDGEGRMLLENDRLRIDWPGVGDQEAFHRVNEKLHEATKPLGGTYVPNPTWNELMDRSLATVHPLGGCVMAEGAEDGVVNHKGQVFSSASGDAVYEDLMICDGSIAPRPLGINPLLTISALAERNCALVAADRGWSIDYTLQPVAQPAATAPLPVGVRFTETMKGHFSKSVTDDFKRGAEAGKAEGSSFKFILTITSEDADTMLREEGHESRAVGTVEAARPVGSAADGERRHLPAVRERSGPGRDPEHDLQAAADGRRRLEVCDARREAGAFGPGHARHVGRHDDAVHRGA